MIVAAVVANFVVTWDVYNVAPWAPAVIAALPLLVRRRWARFAALVLLCAFVVLGAASIGYFYLPAAAVMAPAVIRDLFAADGNFFRG